MRNTRQTVEFSSNTEAANNLIEGLKITKETSEQAKKKMGSLISLGLRGYVMMRMLNNNFGYSFVLDKNVRRPQKGLAYFAIHRIYDNEMNLIFNEDDINLVGKEKKRYCQTRTLEIMMECLERNGYKFYTISTKKAERENLSSYKNLTNVKIRRFELVWNGVQNKFDMEMMESSLGKDEYNNVANGFKANVSHVILCNNNCSDRIIRDMNLEASKVSVVYEKTNDKIEFSYNSNEEQQSKNGCLTKKSNEGNCVNEANTKTECVDDVQIPNEEQMTVNNVNPSVHTLELNTSNQNCYTESNQFEQMNDMNNYVQMNNYEQMSLYNFQQVNGVSEGYIQNNVIQPVDQLQTVIDYQGYDGMPQMSTINYVQNYGCYEQPVNIGLFTTSVVSNETGHEQIGYEYTDYNGYYYDCNCYDGTFGIGSEFSTGFMNYTQPDIQSNALRVHSQYDKKSLIQ